MQPWNPKSTKTVVMECKSPLRRSKRPSDRASAFGLWLALAVLASTIGCAPIRLPAIDPTGNCLFASNGQGTTLQPSCCLCGGGCLPGLTGCLSKLKCQSCFGSKKGCLCCLDGLLPQPAFRDPPPVPPCLNGQAGAAGPNPGIAGPTAGAPCSEDCTSGPPAILIGNKCCINDCLHMPKQGKRGRLMLSPGRVVAPVGGEVVMLAGLCGNDGYLVTGEPIEWMLTPESVGHFIQIAPDDANLLQRISNRSEIEKVSGTFDSRNHHNAGRCPAICRSGLGHHQQSHRRRQQDHGIGTRE
jgi:hypothetical protein